MPKRRPHSPKRGGERPRATRPTDEEIVFGLRAGLAVCAMRPADVIALGYAREVASEVEPAARSLAARGIAVRELPEPELARQAQSDHHEGLVVRARPRAWLPPRDLATLILERRGFAIALDRVRNPYNVGAILRTAAFFGVDAMLLGASADGLAPLALRVAEGGAEHVALSRTTDLAQTLTRMREAGIHVLGAESGESRSLRDHALPRPLVVVLGHEREGLSSRVRAACEATIAIEGRGAIASLNVSIAASVIIAKVAETDAIRGPARLPAK